MTKTILLVFTCSKCKRLFRRVMDIVDSADRAMVQKYFDDIEAGIFDCSIKGYQCYECMNQTKLTDYGYPTRL